MKKHFLAIAAACVLGTGCSSIDRDSPSTLIPARTLNLSPSLTIPAESIVAAGIIWLIVDPLAPNWKVEVQSLGDGRFALNLTMKRFITGGEGEAAQVVRRTAEKMRKQGKAAEWALIEMSEGIESKVPIAQRVAQAVIELRYAPM